MRFFVGNLVVKHVGRCKDREDDGAEAVTAEGCLPRSKEYRVHNLTVRQSGFRRGEVTFGDPNNAVANIICAGDPRSSEITNPPEQRHHFPGAGPMGPNSPD